MVIMMKSRFRCDSKKSVLIAIAVTFLLLANLFIPITNAQKSAGYDTALVYYNEACSMCSMYLNQELLPALEELGVKNIVKKDYVNEKQNRVELNELNKKHNIPPNLQGHFMIFIDDKIILGGHVPRHVIFDLLTKDYDFEKILILQDEMKDAESYFAWSFKGDAKEYDIDTPVKEYIDWFNENKATLTESTQSYDSSWDFETMLPLIITSGFLDGINPCAFAVLLFFITFLYTIHKRKANIIAMGIAYIFAIFIAYFLIGLGLIKAFIFTGSPHLMAKIGAYLMIILGAVVIANHFMPKGKNINLGIPTFSKKYFQKWIYKATVPSALVAGFLVGLCTFPCSGGIYVAVVGLLAAKTTYVQGMTYLIIYNIMFVMPLVFILVAASSKMMTERISKWERSESRVIKLISGIVMIFLGLIILFWFI